MDIREMSYIVMVARENNISRAAEKLFVSQSTVSQTIQQVESRIGCQIFVRTSSGVSLTPLGKRIVEVAERAITFLEETEQNIQDIVAARKGRITLGTSAFWSSFLLPKLLPHFKQEYPGIEIDVKSSTSSLLEDLLLQDEIDVALMTLPVHSDKIATVPLFTERILVMVSKDNPLVKHGRHVEGETLMRLDPELLRNQQFILSSPGHRLRDAADIFFKNHNITNPNIIMVNNSIETAKRLVALDVGIAFVPERFKDFSPAPPLPEYFLLDDSLPQWTVAVAYKKNEYQDKLIANFVCIASNILADRV